MTHTGIWLDKDKAFIVTIENDMEIVQTIMSNIEHFRPHGGSGTKIKGGPQDVVQDSKYLEREKHQLRQYFKAIAVAVRDADNIVIFGPAGTNEKLNKELDENYRDIGAKVRGVEKADSMTNNQVKAWVRDFFELS